MFQAGRLDGAVEECRYALQLDPGRYEAYFNMGLVLSAQGRVEEAIRSLQNAVRLAPDQPHVHFVLGNELAKSGRFEQALEEFGRTLALAPAHQGARDATQAVRERYRAAQQPDEP